MKRPGFTIIELLTVISVMTALTAILVPTMSSVRRYAKGLVNMKNQREVVLAVNVFSFENRDQYPPTTAVYGYGNDGWRWQDPRQVKTTQGRTPRAKTSMAAHLSSYITNSDQLFCPSAPRKYPYWQQAWEAGDSWDHPGTEHDVDPVLGTYCFYWNYIGYTQAPNGPFVGPTSSLGAPRESRMLVSDYLGYGNWRSPDSLGSCERLHNSRIAAGTEVSSDYWALQWQEDRDYDAIKQRFSAGFTDGHVGRFKPGQTVGMRVALDARGSRPFPNAFDSPGTFLIPTKALKTGRH